MLPVGDDWSWASITGMIPDADLFDGPTGKLSGRLRLNCQHARNANMRTVPTRARCHNQVPTTAAQSGQTACIGRITAPDILKQEQSMKIFLKKEQNRYTLQTGWWHGGVRHHAFVRYDGFVRHHIATECRCHRVSVVCIRASVGSRKAVL
jgi:hypothetical protein